MTKTPDIRFTDLELIEPILQAVQESGYDTPSPIQAQTIPHVLSGTDVLGQAQTGTGKTAAFALPTLQKIDTQKKHVQVLVLAPTRELAMQVSEAYRTYAKHLNGINILPIYGGAEYGAQLKGLKRGAHVVVGTPGRIMDHIERGTLKLDKLNTLVLDEADEMLRMGFIDDVEWILKKSPKEKQITLFSATMPRQIQTITKKYLRDEVVIKIKSKTETASTIEQFHLGVQPKKKSLALRRILEVEERDATIIFVNTKAITEELATTLNNKGYRAAALNGDLQQKHRERVITQLKKGAIDIVLATDVAARGLDVERINLVINYDLPRDSESYVHRIGRTGRAGRAGKAILLVTPKDRRAFGFIEKDTNNKIASYPMPTIEQVNQQRVAQFKQRILDFMTREIREEFTGVVEQLHKEHDIEPLHLAAILANMAQGKTPLLLQEQDAVEYTDFSKPLSDHDRKKNKRPRSERREVSSEEMECFRLCVGRRDNVQPRHIVGAIANEAGIEGREIGPITIHDNHTEVFLPIGMPKNILSVLKKTRVMGKTLDISQTKASADTKTPRAKRRSSKPRR